METIKMITIDLDGTLLRSDGSVSDHTVETLQKARQKGVIVAIATGRMYQTAKAYGERLALGDSPMLLFAGGLIQTLESKKILFQQTVPRQDAQDLVNLAREQSWQMQTYIDDVLRVELDEPWIRDYERTTKVKAVICGDEFYRVQGDCNKLLSRGPMKNSWSVRPLLKRPSPDDLISCFRSDLLEIMPLGVDKGHGIRRLGELYDVDPNILWPLAIQKTIWIC